MISYETVKEDFRFLVIEVENQVRLTSRLMEGKDVDLLEKIASKDDYIDNLKSVVENKCFSRLVGKAADDTQDVNALRAIHVASVNLERIGDFCVNIAKQTVYLTAFTVIHHLGYETMFNSVQRALSQVTPVFRTQDFPGALDICRVEYALDKMYKERFDHIMQALEEGKDTQNLVTALFIFRYLERIGDALLNIGEALIFSIIGEKLKIEQYEALQETLSKSRFQGSMDEIALKSIWGSRSGCRISRIQQKHGPGMQGVFKEGVKDKIARERENMEAWEGIAPGLVPKIFGYNENNGTASMIVEFIQGQTVDEVILTSDAASLETCIHALTRLLESVWRRTRKSGVFRTDYMRQLKARLSGVRRVHPQFERAGLRFGDVAVRSSEDLIEKCTEIETQLTAPIHVFIHGDFNANNIFYDADNQVVKFIDLYRSKYADYVQDASVFLVSNFRIPLFETSVRNRINRVIQTFFAFCDTFSRKNEDPTFQARLCMALARSFWTSTRFELNHKFAHAMYLRAQYLLERICEHGGPWEDFRLPRQILYYAG